MTKKRSIVDVPEAHLISETSASVAEPVPAVDIDRWDFDTLGYAQNCDSSPLVPVALAIFKRLDFRRKFGISERKFVAFSKKVESSYRNNPFHNATHVADVLQCVYFILMHGGLYRYLDELDTLAIFISAIMHDVGHPGVDNLFLRTNKSPLYQKYPTSTLENHHAHLAFAILRESRCALFSGLSESEQQQLFDRIRSIILSTDVERSREIMAQFKQHLEVLGDAPENWRNEEHRLVLLKVCMHAADISNTGRPAALSKKWALLVSNEWFRQEQKALQQDGVALGHRDGHRLGLPEIQYRFITDSALPFFQLLATLLPQLARIVDILTTNQKMWLAACAPRENPTGSE